MRIFLAGATGAVSASATKFSITRFWSPRIRSVFDVSRRPGCARRSTSWRSSGRPASPVPSSVTISRKRSRYGRRMMLLTRSGGTVVAVCSTGIVDPGGSGRSAVPGSQLRKYSPMSVCGSTEQKTSVRNWPKSGFSISAVSRPNGPCCEPGCREKTDANAAARAVGARRLRGRLGDGADRGGDGGRRRAGLQVTHSTHL